MRNREDGRYEIRHVPAIIREQDKKTGTSRTSVVPKYERVCFEKEKIHVPGKTMATLMHPGHPLMQAMIMFWLDRTRALLKEGCILVDPTDDSTHASVLVILEHTVRESASDDVVSRRLQFVRLCETSATTNAGPAAHLNLRAASREERSLCADLLNATWLKEGLEDRAHVYASQEIAAEHYHEVKTRREFL